MSSLGSPLMVSDAGTAPQGPTQVRWVLTDGHLESEQLTSGRESSILGNHWVVFLFQVWYDQKGFHSLPSYLNHLNNLILWRLLPPAVDWRQYGRHFSLLSGDCALQGKTQKQLGPGAVSP